jgi:hypothetical protein
MKGWPSGRMDDDSPLLAENPACWRRRSSAESSCRAKIEKKINYEVD